MGDESNCKGRLALPAVKEMKTSTQIAFPYRPALTMTYDKKPLPNIPVLKSKEFKIGSIWTAFEGYKSTYHDTYNKTLTTDGNLDLLSTKMLKRPKEYSKLGRIVKPLTVGNTEYGEQYPIKPLPPVTKGFSVEEETTCPMILTGRDEREPIPLTENYSKYLDIYVSSTRLAHRQFTLQEQKSIAAKDIVTVHDTMEIPKGKGFGCKFPAHLYQYLEKRDEKMTDKVQFKTEHNLRFVPKGLPKVPHFGSESETRSAYQAPSGIALPHIFDRFVEFPQTIGTPTAKQTLCPPAMYTTETYAINNHTSPQTVV